MYPNTDIYIYIYAYTCIAYIYLYLFINLFIYLDRPSAEQLQNPRYADAEHYYRRALEGFERTLGPEHGDTWRHGKSWDSTSAKTTSPTNDPLRFLVR